MITIMCDRPWTSQGGKVLGEDNLGDVSIFRKLFVI